MDSPYWAKGPSAKSSEETCAETIYFISKSSFKTKPVITLTSFLLSSLLSSLFFLVSAIALSTLSCFLRVDAVSRETAQSLPRGAGH